MKKRRNIGMSSPSSNLSELPTTATTSIASTKLPTRELLAKKKLLITILRLLGAVLLLGTVCRAFNQSTSPTVDCNFGNSSSILDSIVIASPNPATDYSGSVQKMPQKQLHQMDDDHNPRPLKVLCLLMTHSQATEQVRAVWDTWGSKCDTLLIASNTTQTAGLPSVVMGTRSTYWNLWTKLNESLHYIHDDRQGQFKEYDWIYKVDDDSFVIMENLKLFLSSFHSSLAKMKDPLVFGYVLKDYKWKDHDQYFQLPENRPFADYFFRHVQNASDTTAYLAGGSGYVMNRRYLEEFIQALDGVETNNRSPAPAAKRQPTTMYGPIPEDMAHGATMLARGIVPRKSRDALGRERFLPEPPDLWELRQQNNPDPKQQQRDLKRKTKKTRGGPKSTATYAISFHHVSPKEMRSMYHRLYTCRTNV